MTSPAMPGQILRDRAIDRPDTVAFLHLGGDDAPLLEVTYAGLYRRASAIATMLISFDLRQRPVLLMYPPGPDFAEAFFGALLAGAIAVPVPVPQFPAQVERLASVADDCHPGAVLTTSALAGLLASRFDVAASIAACPWVATDSLEPMHGFELPEVSLDSIALLQYTSGSTAHPRGVMVTQANIAHNATTILRDLPVPGVGRSVSWLPHFHDMGLIAGIVTPIYRDFPSVQMAPLMFLQRPLRWLETITRHQAHISGAPNFAYALCVRAAATADLSGLDLSSWDVAFVGAEPVRPATLLAFAECFAPCGFRHEALTPCYGMAEATLLVTSKRIGTLPTVHALSRSALGLGQARPTTEDSALHLAGCGYPVTATDLRIVDPESHREVPRRYVGEIWVAGPQIASGYWGSQDEDSFQTVLVGSDEGPFLRSGDLGFLNEDGELVFVDRLKDLMILNGQNYICHDLELTVGASHPLLSPESCIVCGIERDDQVRVTVIVELLSDSVQRSGEVAQAIRAALFTRHGVPVHTVAFLAPRRLRRTTSGKLQRRWNADLLINGDLRALALVGEPLPRPYPASVPLTSP